MFRKFTATLATFCLTAGLALSIPALADGPGPVLPKKKATATAPAQPVAPTPLPKGTTVQPDGTTVLPGGATAPPEQVGRNGEIPLANGSLRLFVPATHTFYTAQEATAHLQRIGAQTPSGEVLGMIAPATSRPLDETFWGAVISINPLGHVAEERGDRLSAPDFPDEVRAARPAPAPRLESFAVLPSADPVRHTVTWTERYPAANATVRSVRTEQRILGRDSVAGITIDGRGDQIGAITGALPEISRMVTFTPGKAYGDYASGSDPAPAYDLPSLLTLKAKPAAAGATPQAQTSAEPGTAPAAALDMATVTKWLPWAGAGLLVLALIPWLVGRSRRRTVVEADPNLVPPPEKKD
jgi:hypothetical protein